MAKQQVGISINAVAGHDLSSHQYRFVRLISADTISGADAAAATVIGVLQNKPTSGNAAAVRILGHSKVLSGRDDLAVGNFVGTTAAGSATATAASTHTGTVGLVMSAASSGSMAEVLLFGPVGWN